MLRMTSEDASFLPRSISDRWDRDRFASSAMSWRVLDCAIRVWRSACPMRVRSNIRHPQPMRARSLKLTMYQAWAKFRALGFARCDWCPTFVLSGQASAAHQTGCVLAANANALADQHAPHLPARRRRRNFQHQHRDYAPREQRREDYSSRQLALRCFVPRIQALQILHAAYRRAFSLGNVLGRKNDLNKNAGKCAHPLLEIEGWHWARNNYGGGGN